jgi:hypothetical protein
LAVVSAGGDACEDDEGETGLVWVAIVSLVQAALVSSLTDERYLHTCMVDLTIEVDVSRQRFASGESELKVVWWVM